MEQTVSFPEQWTPPAALSGALPRETRLTGPGKLQAILAAGVILAGIPLYVSMHKEIADQEARNRALRESGARVTAEIRQLWHQGRSSIPMMAYAFTVQGVTFQNDCEVPNRRWDHIRKAGMIPVVYLPKDPRVNHPADWEETPTAGFIEIGLPAALWACGLFLGWNLWKRSWLLAKGIAAPGVVIRCYRVKGGYTVVYQFRTADGAIAAGRGSSGRELAKGAVICVLYAREKPSRNLSYPFGSHRIA
jgi:hypothetical protein